MKSSELKLGHAYKLAGKEGPAFFINTHPHDGGTMIMAWNDAEIDEELYIAVDSCEIEYEIPVSDTLMVFTDQYDAFLLASRVLSSLPTILEHVKAIETRAAVVQKTATSQGDSLWHAMETIDDRVHDLLTLLEDDEFRALTGADRREKELTRLRRDSYRYAKARAHAYQLGIGNPTPEEFDALVDAFGVNATQTQRMKAAIQNAENEMVELDLLRQEACGPQSKSLLPDSGRDAALWTCRKMNDLGSIYDSKGELVANTYYQCANGITEAHNAAIRALAAHPAPSSDKPI